MTPEVDSERDGRDRAEESLRQSEELFRLLVGSVTEYAIFMLDPQGRVATWNLGAERIKGYSASEIIGQHFSVFYPEEEVTRGWPQHELDRAAVQGRFEDEGWRIRKDGSRFWANVILTAIHDSRGVHRGFAKVTRDLTARMQREEELRHGRDMLEARVQQRTAELTRLNAALKAEVAERTAAEERFRQLVFALPAAVYTTDGQGRLTLYNDAAAELWGRRPELGKELWCGSFRILHLDGTPLPHEECPMALALLEGRSTRGAEILIERPDGKRFCVLPHPQPLRDGSGAVVGGVNMLVDITDRKNAEEELRILERELREKVADLGEADRRKDEFLATLAHELRNPLAPLRHGLQLLHLADGDAELHLRARDMMDRQLGQMVRLVDDLLDVSRISKNRLQVRKQAMDLSAAVQSALEAVRTRIDDGDHELEVGLPQSPVFVYGDLTRLSQVITNLLHNAAKFTPRGGQIRLAVDDRGDEVVLSVRDNGPGIAREHLPQIFEMFSQPATTLERPEGGLGIGLALARALVEMHGGTIEAKSVGAGSGSEFLVRLPTCRPPVLESLGEAAPSEAVEWGSRLRVVVADDNQDSADGLGTLLTMAGHQVRTAHDGMAAMEATADFRPDIALLDIGMPRINGYEVARRIRQEPWGAEVVLVAITGWGQQDDKARAAEAGFDHHLTKPVDPAVLEALMESVGRRVPERVAARNRRA